MIICDSCHCEVEEIDIVNVEEQGENFCTSCYLEWNDSKESDGEQT